MLRYFYSVKDKNNITYSCDMIRIKFQVFPDELNNIAKHFLNINRSDIQEYPLNFSSFKYKHLFKISYSLDSIAVVGLSLNSFSRDDMYKGFFEFNPNKVLHNELAQKDFEYVRKRCENFDISHWDLAIDIPFDRFFVHMEKDKRIYKLVTAGGNEKTEYLGQRNKGGFVKLYNKSIESKLDYDLTRLEITFDSCDNSEFFDKYKNYVPNIYISAQQIALRFNSSCLSDTDKVLIELLSNNEDCLYYFNKLGRGKKEKLKPYLFGVDNRLELDNISVYKILTFVFDIVNFGIDKILQYDNI